MPVDERMTIIDRAYWAANNRHWLALRALLPAGQFLERRTGRTTIVRALMRLAWTLDARHKARA